MERIDLQYANIFRMCLQASGIGDARSSENWVSVLQWNCVATSLLLPIYCFPSKSFARHVCILFSAYEISLLYPQSLLTFLGRWEMWLLRLCLVNHSTLLHSLCWSMLLYVHLCPFIYAELEGFEEAHKIDALGISCICVRPFRTLLLWRR